MRGLLRLQTSEATFSLKIKKTGFKGQETKGITHDWLPVFVFPCYSKFSLWSIHDCLATHKMEM